MMTSPETLRSIAAIYRDHGFVQLDPDEFEGTCTCYANDKSNEKICVDLGMLTIAERTTVNRFMSGMQMENK